jgi:HD-GYP domain-containing protein (c-di-GMP phosphodiesterase class II)
MSNGSAGGVGVLELLGSMSLATDLGTGQPSGHGLRTAVIAAGLARHLGLGDDQVDVTRQVALLRFLGCTADSYETARMVGGDDLSFLAAMAPVAMGRRAEAGRALFSQVGRDGSPLHRMRMIAGVLADRDGMRRSLTSHCEVAARLATRLGLRPGVVEALAHGHERWDGGGFPDGLSGEAVPVAVRVAVVARDADLLWRSSPEDLKRVLRSRRGYAYDPGVVDAFEECGRDLLNEMDSADPWPAAILDPGQRVLAGPDLTMALAAVGDFADLKSPWTRGHCGRVAEFAVAAARSVGASIGDVELLRGAALVADIGRVGVPNGVWDRAGPLSVADWERVRMHSYLTERVFARCPPLADLGRVAAAHHERLDGSGYHRAAKAPDLDGAMRVLAAADVVAALGEPRPHRHAYSPPEIIQEIEREVRHGRLDRVSCDAVLAAAGHRDAGRRRTAGPLGLTDREIEVLRMIARGRSNREVAEALRLSPKTVGRHVENLYVKMGVSTRPAAALMAMEHHLLDS